MRWACLVASPPEPVLSGSTALASKPSATALLQTDIEVDPLEAGWKWVDLDYFDEKGEGEWTVADAASGQHCVVIKSGGWQSPVFPVVPFQYYELCFRAKGNSGGYWAAQFCDQNDEPLTADHYSGIDASEDWEANRFCFNAKADACSATIMFRNLKPDPMCIAEPEVRAIESADVADWVDSVYATIPPVEFAPPAQRWEFIPRTMTKLREGDPVTIVMLGDSIMNDVGNSAYPVLIERAYPGARVNLVTSVGGSKGCAYFAEEDRLEQYVFAYRPDLLMVGGISHGFNPEPYRTLIRAVRARSDLEIMVLTDTICPLQHSEQAYLDRSGRPKDKALEDIASFRNRLAHVAREEGCEFLDLRTPWEDYLAECGRPLEWFMRDRVHANVRGVQVAGRMMARYFTPTPV